MAVTAAALLWGTGGIGGALLAHHSELTPLAVGAWRLLVGGPLVLLLLVLLRSGGLLPNLRQLRRVIVLGVLAAMYQGCYFVAVGLTTVSLATLVTLGAAPVLVVLGHAALVRRRPTMPVVAALCLATGGLAMLFGSPAAAGQVGTGLVFALLSAAGFAATTLLGSRPVAGLLPLPAVGWAFTIGGTILGSLALVAGPVTLTPDLATASLVLYLGVLPTALAYALYFRGLRTVRPGHASLIALLEPLTAATLGALVFGESLGWCGASGALMILVAVILGRR